MLSNWWFISLSLFSSHIPDVRILVYHIIFVKTNTFLKKQYFNVEKHLRGKFGSGLDWFSWRYNSSINVTTELLDAHVHHIFTFWVGSRKKWVVWIMNEIETLTCTEKWWIFYYSLAPPEKQKAPLILIHFYFMLPALF